jgi:hypothetical protein
MKWEFNRSYNRQDVAFAARALNEAQSLGMEDNAVLVSGRVFTRKMIDNYIARHSSIHTEEELLSSISLGEPYPDYIQIQQAPDPDSIQVQQGDSSQPVVTPPDRPVRPPLIRRAAAYHLSRPFVATIEAFGNY